MNRLEVIDRFAEETGRTKTLSSEIYNDVVNFIYNAILAGEKIDIYGFGVLEPYVSKSKVYHDLAGNKRMSKEKVRVRFKPSRRFIKMLNPEEKEEVEN